MSDDLQGGSLEEIVLTREQLEEMREVQEESKHCRGIGNLLEAYINARGSLRNPYLRDESEYVRGEEICLETITAWMRGTSPFHLKHLKGLVDELGVSKEHLE